jgi:MFS family permease
LSRRPVPISLIASRRFGPFFLAQFFSACNDNLYKNILILLLSFQTAQFSDLSGTVLVSISMGIYVLPFFLLSATAGQLADKYDKAVLVRAVKILELVAVVIAAGGLLSMNLPALLLAIMLIGLAYTQMGPIKYALLPQHLQADELVTGNALIVSSVFVAYVLGTFLAGVFAGYGGAGTRMAAGLVIVLGIAGWYASRFVPAAPPSSPDLAIGYYPPREIVHNLLFLKENNLVLISALGISWSWFYAGNFMLTFPSYGREILGGNEMVVTLLLSAFALGIALGALICAQLSKGKINLHFIALGIIGLSLTAFDIYLAHPEPATRLGLSPRELFTTAQVWRVTIDLMLLAISAGFYAVTFYALLQAGSPPERRARIIAANNILNALFTVAAAVFSGGLVAAGLKLPYLPLIVGVLNTAVAVALIRRLPNLREQLEPHQATR